MDTVTCPNCGNENAYFVGLDKMGAHYVCPDCDPEYEWCDTTVQFSNEDDEDDDF